MAYSKKTDEGLIVPKKWYDALPRVSWNRFTKVETNFPWFDVYETTPETYAIYESGQFEEVISYLVLGEEKAALIDSGNGIGDIKDLTEELTDLPIEVINTHAHGDHVGGNWAFEEVAAFNHQYVRDRMKGRSNQELGNFLKEEMLNKPLPKGVDKNTFSLQPYEVTRWLKENDLIDLGGKTLKVIHTPGHTPDGICLLESKENLLFTGDTFYPAPIYIYSKGTSLEEFITSYEKIIALDFIWAMPAHNETMIEKKIVEEVLAAAKSIKNGESGEYIEGFANGVNVRRYDYERFSLIVRVPL
ncbi:MBL fold metallo-hydrolase [Candidatus Bathyarchaeota archaeon]|nr:MBL fold metallo-hydrolase [Candidatus Bathyarchaeota archaeon]